MSTDREGERRRRSAEDLYQHGRAALREGQKARAKELLLQAVDYNREHSEAWLWLSATTDDPAEQKKYLEWAIAANPGNAAARRGLGLVTGKIKQQDLMKEGEAIASRLAPEPEKTEVRRNFKCLQCGGALRFDPELVDLKCSHCGFVEVVAEESAAGSEQVLDFSLPTRQGHRWAEAERHFICQQCSATSILGAGQTSAQCPFCGSAALIAAPEERELLPVQSLIPIAFEAERAQQIFREWLGRGFFAPDDLKELVTRTGLHPAYAPFWIFNATLTAHWRGQVEEGHGKYRQWVWRTGDRTFFYANLLVAGLKALPAQLLKAAQNFDLSKLIVYKPEYLAEWPAALYDRALADASLDAREMMVRDAEKQLATKAAPGKTVLNLSVTNSDFSGQTYRLALLPLWIGAYAYRGQTYRVLINGQNGTIAGDKPRDPVKIVLAAIAAAALLVIGIVAALVIYKLLWPGA